MADSEADDDEFDSSMDVDDTNSTNVDDYGGSEDDEFFTDYEDECDPNDPYSEEFCDDSEILGEEDQWETIETAILYELSRMEERDLTAAGHQFEDLVKSCTFQGYDCRYKYNMPVYKTERFISRGEGYSVGGLFCEHGNNYLWSPTLTPTFYNSQQITTDDRFCSSETLHAATPPPPPGCPNTQYVSSRKLLKATISQFGFWALHSVMNYSTHLEKYAINRQLSFYNFLLQWNWSTFCRSKTWWFTKIQRALRFSKLNFV